MNQKGGQRSCRHPFVRAGSYYRERDCHDLDILGALIFHNRIGNGVRKDLGVFSTVLCNNRIKKVVPWYEGGAAGQHQQRYDQLEESKCSHSSLVFHYPEFFQPVLKGLVAHPEKRSRPADCPLGPLHGLDDQFLFKLFKRYPSRREVERKRHSSCAGLMYFGGEVFRQDGVPLGHKYTPLDNRFKLADVAGPGIVEKQLESRF